MVIIGLILTVSMMLTVSMLSQYNELRRARNTNEVISSLLVSLLEWPLFFLSLVCEPPSRGASRRKFWALASWSLLGVSGILLCGAAWWTSVIILLAGTVLWFVGALFLVYCASGNGCRQFYEMDADPFFW